MSESGMRFLLLEDSEQNGVEIWLRHKGFAYAAQKSVLGLRGLPSAELEGAVAVIVALSHPREFLTAVAMLRGTRNLRQLPVVAAVPANSADMSRSLQRLGVFLRLERPFTDAMFEAALEAAATYRAATASDRPEDGASTLGAALREGCFEIRSPHEALLLAEALAAACPDPARQMSGIHELLMNAIEHGNLGLDGEAKGQYLKLGTWPEEIKRRLEQPENRDKIVSVRLRREDKLLTLTVRDQGRGFDWRKALGRSMESISGLNGRGLLLARALSFDALEFKDPGNEAVAQICIRAAHRSSQEISLTAQQVGRTIGPSQPARPEPAPGPTRERTPDAPASVAADDFGLFFMQNRDLMVVADERFRRVNPAVSAVLGWSERELVGRPVLDLIHPDDHVSFADRMGLERDRPGDEHPPLALRMRTSDGGFRTIEWLATLGPEQVIYAVGRDISALSYAIETLANQNQELKQLHTEIEREQRLAGQMLGAIRRMGCLDAPGIRYVLSSVEYFNGDVALAAETPQGELRWLLGDFTGHGLSAAIGTTPVASAFYATTRKNIPLGEVLATLNDSLKALLPVGLFCAAAVLTLDASKKVLRVCNAGLPPVLVRKGRSRLVLQIPSTAVPLGLVPSAEQAVKIESIAVEEGDEIFVYSDGLTEISNVTGEMFGTERVVQALVSTEAEGQAFERLLGEVAAFRGEQRAHDDLSLVTVSVGEVGRRSALPPSPAPLKAAGSSAEGSTR